MILTPLIAAFLLGSPAPGTAPAALNVAPISVVDGDSDGDSDRKRGQRGRRGRNNDSDRDSDRDSDNDSDRRGRRGDRDRRGDCIDVNGDGRCEFGTGRRTDNRRDDRRRDGCIDRNRDGRCDYGTVSRGGGLPDMISSVLFGRGQRSAADRWVPGGVRNVRYIDQDRNRVPERATFLDGAGRIAQVWLDTNRDGRADRVQFYRNGRLFRTASR